MSRKIVPPAVTLLLLVGLVVLPIAAGVVLAVASLLAAMGDAIGGGVLRYIALGCGILWVVDLAALVLAQGVYMLGDDDKPPEK